MHKIIIYLIVSILLQFVLSCSKAPQLTKPDDRYCLSDSLKRMVTKDTAQVKNLFEELNLSAKVSFDRDNVVPVFPIVGGIVTSLDVELGDYVKKDQVLAVIKSGQFADYTQQLITAEANLLQAQKNLHTKEDMFEDGLASKTDVSLAQKEVRNAEAELNRIKEITKIYNIGTTSDYIVRAPVDGFVVDKKIARDMQIRPDRTESIFTISSLNDVWILADVYQTDIAKVKVGYQATVTTISYPDKKFPGTIDKIFNVLDENSPALKVRIRLQNPDFILKPGMFCKVNLVFEQPEKMICLPSKAIIFDKNKNYAMIYHDACNIETREIKTFSTIGERTYIESGIKPNEIVLSKYHLLVYDALND